jgi:GDP-L-fucose synthase
MSLSDAEFNELIADYPPLINIGCGIDLTIRELAETVAEVVSFNGALRFDASRPDGTPRKLLDVSRLFALGWRPRVTIEQGIGLAYQAYSESTPAESHST